MSYIPHTEKEIQEMLSAINKKDIEDLFNDIPKDIRIKECYKNIPEKLSEIELTKLLEKLAESNKNIEDNISFLGGGIYNHYIPVLVDYLSSRSEFVTAYTPYQPEGSQGNLQAIFEYQTCMCELTGMDISNASMYDGPSALAEAVLLAYSHHRKKRDTFIIPSNLHPEYKEVVLTYTQNLDIQIKEVKEKNGTIDINHLKELVNEKVGAVVVANPNFYGLLEDLEEISKIAKSVKSLAIAVVNPITLGILEPPGKYNFDIVVGDGQPLGIYPTYGAPSFGFFTAKKEFLRKMPGRIVGQTLDSRGERGFVLTIQTREQHIKRERATSNICTNQALMSLRGLIYLVCLGKKGLYEVGYQCIQKSHYLAEEINKIDGYSLKYPNQPFFNEFVVKCPKSAEDIEKEGIKNNIFIGIPLSKWYPERKDELLISVTEKNTKKDFDILINFLKNLKN